VPPTPSWRMLAVDCERQADANLRLSTGKSERAGVELCNDAVGPGGERRCESGLI
jgi:hypothetical protein